MSIHGGRSFGRGVVAVCAAGALLVSLLASPASAEVAPNDTQIKGLLKGGEIVLQQEDPDPDLVFPLGVKDDTSVKDKTEDSVCDSELNPKKEKEPRSHFTADVSAGGKMNNFVFDFAQGSTGEKFTDIMGQEYEACAQLEVKNVIQGQIDGKQVTLDKGPQVSVNFIIKEKPEDGKVAFVCRIDIEQDVHNGKFSTAKDPVPSDPPKPQHDWNLVHQPKEQKFEVPEVQAEGMVCPSFVANELNDALGLPTFGSAHFKWAVYDCSTTTCSTLHPNKS